MTIEQLEEILQQEASNLRSDNGQLLFDFEGLPMALRTSQQHNRMRIITPITESNNLTEEQGQKMLIANFHKALDARYAISNGNEI